MLKKKMDSKKDVNDPWKKIATVLNLMGRIVESRVMWGGGGVDRVTMGSESVEQRSHGRTRVCKKG